MGAAVNRASRDERGASLVLAIVFLFAIAIVLGAIANLAGTAATNTFNLRAQRTTELAAENAATLAIAQVRSNPNLCSSGGTNLSPQLYCAQIFSPLSTNTRTVDFYACPGAAIGTPCSPTASGVILHSQVVYDDVPPNSPFSSACVGATNPITCGITVAIKVWDVRSADN